MRKLLFGIVLFLAGCASVSHNYLPFNYQTYYDNPQYVYDSLCTSYGISPVSIDEWNYYEFYTQPDNKKIKTRYWVGKNDTLDNKFVFTFEEPDSILTIRIEK